MTLDLSGVTTTGVTELDSTEGMMFENHQGLEAAVRLFKEGLITQNEMVQLLQWSDVDAEPKEVYALAAGEFRISKAALKSATNLSDKYINEIGETMRGHTEWFKDVVGVAWTPGSAFLSGADNLREWVTDLGDISIPEQEGLADPKARQALLDSLDGIPSDQITESERRDIERGLKGAGYGASGALEALADYVEYVDEEALRTLAPSLLPEKSGFVAEDVLPELDTARRAELEERRGVYPTEVISDAPPGSFAAFLASGPLVQPGDPDYLEPSVPTPADEIVSDPRMALYGGDTYYDRSTNKEYTKDEYMRILEGRQMVAAGYGPDAAYNFSPSGQVEGGGRMGEAFAEAELGPNLNDPLVRGAYGTAIGGAGIPQLATMPQYLQDVIKAPSRFPDQPWEKAAYSWTPGSSVSFLNGLSADQKRLWKTSLEERGLFNVADEQGRSYFDSSNQNFMLGQITEQVLGVSRGMQVSPWRAVPVLGAFKRDVETQQRALLAHMEALKASMTPKKLPFSVPRSLRSIPDIRELRETTRATIRQKLGRDPTDNELIELGDDLSGYHRTSQQEQIALAYAEWEGSDNVMDGADLEEVISNPALVGQYEIEQKYANEINLNDRQETNADSFSRALNAIGGGGHTFAGTSTTGSNVVRV